MPDTPLEQFHALRSLRRCVSELSQHHLEALSLFHPTDDLTKIGQQKVNVGPFSRQRPTAAEKAALIADPTLISITSTATCIKSLLWCPDFLPDDHADYSILLTALNKRWEQNKLTFKNLDLGSGDPYTVGLLLPVLAALNAPPASPLITGCLAAAKQSVKDGGARIQMSPASGYLTYWLLLGLESWKEDLPAIASKALEWSRMEFYRQLSLFAADVDERSDAFQLGYNLLIQHRFARGGVRATVIKLGLDTLFKIAQLKQGVWEKKEPVFIYGEKGNAYCFSFELLTALLGEFQGEAEPALPI